MKPPPFRYEAPDTLAEALELLARHGDDAKALAGGQSLVPAMSFRLARPTVLVDLGRLQGLDGIRRLDHELRFGAMCRQRVAERSRRVSEELPLLAAALPHIAHPQIRSRGTVGGSLAHADPAGELPAVVLALGGRLRLASSAGERWVDAGRFFTGLFETACRPDELLVEIALPVRRPGSGWGFREFARRHGDYALAGVAAVLETRDSRITGASIALFSVGDGPVRGRAPELVGLELAGGDPDGAPGSDPAIDDALGEALRAAARTIARDHLDPPGDLQASPEYRRHLAEVLIRRALEDAVRRVRDGGDHDDDPTTEPR